MSDEVVSPLAGHTLSNQIKIQNPSETQNGVHLNFLNLNLNLLYLCVLCHSGTFRDCKFANSHTHVTVLYRSIGTIENSQTALKVLSSDYTYHVVSQQVQLLRHDMCHNDSTLVQLQKALLTTYLLLLGA